MHELESEVSLHFQACLDSDLRTVSNRVRHESGGSAASGLGLFANRSRSHVDRWNCEIELIAHDCLEVIISHQSTTAVRYIFCNAWTASIGVLVVSGSCGP